MFRVVLDTVVVVSAARSQSGASNRLLDMVADGKLKMLSTSALFLEYESVLCRPEHRLVHRYSEKDIMAFLGGLAAVLEPIQVHYQWRPQLRDPNDEMVLEAAINGRADAIATFNQKDFLPAAIQFGVRIMSPQELLKGVMK